MHDKKSGRGYLTINTTGMQETQKEALRMAWTDLHKENPKLSTQLFYYAFFRGGIGFSPKTWMGLVPTYVKEHLTVNKGDGTQASYIDTYRNFPTDRMVNATIIEQFVRLNWNNSKLAPKKGGEGTMYDYSEVSDGVLKVHAKKDRDDLAGLQYIRTESDGKTYLWERVTPLTDTKSSIEFVKLMPLGNNGEYIEMSLRKHMDAMEVVEEETSTEDTPNELPAEAQKDAAISPEEGPIKPAVSETRQIQKAAELVPIIMELHDLKEGAAVGYLESLRDRARKGNVSKFTKEGIAKIAEKAGLKLDVDKALEWFKQLC
jgi:hypothetical protein